MHCVYIMLTLCHIRDKENIIDMYYFQVSLNKSNDGLHRILRFGLQSIAAEESAAIWVDNALLFIAKLG